jgi:hypothetical protein
MSTTDESHGTEPDLETMERDLVELRRWLQEGAAVQTSATSIDGRTFEFQASLDDPVPLGGFVVIETADGRHYVGQVTDRRMDRRSRGRVRVDVPAVSFGLARVSQGDLDLVSQMAVGSGTLLARLDGNDLIALTHNDVFQNGSMAGAEPGLLGQLLESTGRGRSALDVGWSPFAGPDVRVTLRAGGFNRHTFLCGQSGSGKTFSLGVILERLLLDTALRMVVIDPNSDFVRLNEVRSKTSLDRTLATPTTEGEYAAFAGRYQASVENLLVLRPSDPQRPLEIRFSELTPREQAAVLKLDPLRDRTEFNAYWRIAERMEGHSYSLTDVHEASTRILQEDARQIGLRMENLGIADWGVWADEDSAALGDYRTGDWRGLVLDVGGLGSADEQSVMAMAVLGRLWRRREERNPILLVIDEAHNVCPAEPVGNLQALATEHVIRIAGEGRKFGIYLLLSTQRPQKLHPNVLSQCDNLVLMRMNSSEDIAHLATTFSFVPPRLLEQSTSFTLGEALLAGKIAPTPTAVKFEGRLSPEGGGDIPTDWAARRDG